MPGKKCLGTRSYLGTIVVTYVLDERERESAFNILHGTDGGIESVYYFF